MRTIYDLVSPDYMQTLRDTHAAQKRWGNGGKYHWLNVAEYAASLGAKSILDYGCGQGLLRTRLEVSKLGFTVTEYDPGIPGKDVMPSGVFDLIVATDVCEHIEPEFVVATLLHMRSLARLGLFAVISLRPAALTLTDGRNAHLTLQPANWWIERIRDAGFHVAHHSEVEVKGLLVKAIV